MFDLRKIKEYIDILLKIEKEIGKYQEQQMTALDISDKKNYNEEKAKMIRNKLEELEKQKKHYYSLMFPTYD